MESSLWSLVTIESSQSPDSGLQQPGKDGQGLIPSAPARALPRHYHAIPPRPESVELERMRQHQHSQPIQIPRVSGSSSAQTLPHATPSLSEASGPIPWLEEGPDRDVEMSRPPSRPGPTDTELEVAEVLPSVWDPHKNRFRLAAVSLLNLGNGLNDSAPGALIPYMEKHYSIGYAVVSLIFVGNALGFITGAMLLDPVRARLGRAGILALAQALMVAGYVPVVCSASTPFPVVVASFFLVGLGMALNLAMSNIFCGSLRSSTALLGVLHGAYGIGGTVGPLIATSIVTAAGADAETGRKAYVWARYYFIPLGLAVFNAVYSFWSFLGYEAELSPTHPLVAAPRGSDTSSSTTAGGPAGGAAAIGETWRTGSRRLASPWAAAGVFAGSRVVLLGAVFIFAYQGAEVSISGWVISFLIGARGGDPASVGYVTAGFWAGITVGRLLLSGPGAHRFGERRFVYGLTAGAAVFQALVWSVPNVVGDAVAVSVVGLLLGPVYPCAASLFMRCMGRAERVSGMGVISAFGSSGGAAAPFTTGLLAQVAGTFVLHPIAIFLFGVMMVCWWAIPKERKRTE